CVALYEAVYGVRPFEGRSLAELREARIHEQIVPAPRNTKIPVALRDLLVRGLAADPDQRWPSMHALLDRLRPLIAPRRRRAIVALSGAVALGLGLTGAGLAYQAHMGQRCTGAQAQLDGIWDDVQRQHVADAILGTGLSYAPDTWIRVAEHLDQHAQAWVDKHTAVCEATSVRHEQSSEVMDLRMACLRQQRVALREAVNVLAAAEPDRVAQAVTLVTGLPDPARCDDVEALRAELPLPQDPGVAKRVEDLRDELAQVRALHGAGDYDLALTQADAIVDQADALDHPPLLAEALLERGLVRQEEARYDEAEQDLERAYVLATKIGHFAVEAAAVRELAFVVGHDQARHEAGLQWGKTALALAQNGLAAPRDEATALGVIGVVLWRKGELDDALDHHRRALVIFEKLLGTDHLAVADALHNAGTVLWKQGELDDALDHHRRALVIF
ncbi:MAG: tetratricopeptide repeat protein, partial [Myxococcales bacterium]|nr:tetratricopeptide repeat protein [Myxococcales bacterium]